MSDSEIYKLHDEHQQPIEIWDTGHGKVYWAFQLVSENDKEWNGPFKTRAAAIRNAERFCS